MNRNDPQCPQAKDAPKPQTEPGPAWLMHIWVIVGFWLLVCLLCGAISGDQDLALVMGMAGVSLAIFARISR
jgi:hypothetical protein